MSAHHPTDRGSLERDCDVENLRASGPGGQHRNRRETGIRLVHRPTGTMVMATERRSRAMNLDMAFARMAERIDRLQARRRRRRPTAPSRAARERRMKHKRQRGEVKALRQKLPE